MSTDPAASVRTALARSPLARAVAAVRADGGRALALGLDPVRRLTAAEIDLLEKYGNRAEDWRRVRVTDGFDPQRIVQCTFSGDVLMGRYCKKLAVRPGLPVPSGLARATVANCVIGHDALVQDIRLLANYVIGSYAILFDCGAVTCAGQLEFGNGANLPLGVQSGGRDVRIFAGIDVATAEAVALGRNQQEMQETYVRAVIEFTAAVRGERGIIENGACVCHVPSVTDSYIGFHACIDGATCVENSTIESRPDDPTEVASGACVLSSLLQPGSSIQTLAIVERSVLTEHSHVQYHAKVIDSILGPNTVVGAGEVTSCLLGPFTSLHHQSLLIATLWPLGKGNVSYGANVGSNHTGKAPDQELIAGEGMFIGLGVSLKFPADFKDSPYTILASGITTLPQKVRFPFSLINAPARQFSHISPAVNEIIPGWLLSDNLYALKRSETKFMARNCARRQSFEYRVIRPQTIELMRDACRRLENIFEVKEVYTDRDIDGLGKNYLWENLRISAVGVYRFFIRLYALQSLKDHLQELIQSQTRVDLKALLTESGASLDWEYARSLLSTDLRVTDVRQALSELPEMLEQVGNDVARSKAKDDERGIRIIDDYAQVHVPAASDPCVTQTWADVRKQQQEVNDLLHRLEHL